MSAAHVVDALVLDNVSKTYRRRGRRLRRSRVEAIRAVDSLSMTVERGQVYGFLGPNGAGKTTTLRMVLGLVAPSGGSLTVLGQRPGSPDALARVGALIEGPAFYPFLSGRDNLRVLATYGRLDRAAVERALESVSLTSRAADRYATYSLGMKQRLGVAAALLKDPELVVLDEPTNGLDPAGMRDMRALIRRLGGEGRTVVLSSHLMADVQQLCDRVAVIDRGRILVESSVRELRGGGELVVGATPSDLARSVLSSRPDVTGVRSVGDTLRAQADPASTADIVRALVGAGVDLIELRRDERELEDVFIALTDQPEEKRESAHA